MPEALGAARHAEGDRLERGPGTGRAGPHAARQGVHGPRSSPARARPRPQFTPAPLA